MTLTRRRFLTASGAGLCALAVPTLARARAMPVLQAGPSSAQIAPLPYPVTPVWAFGPEGVRGTIPGPEIRVRAGDRVRRRLSNGLSQPTAVHWHGIRIDNAMDGAAGLTQDAVEPGDVFDYDFVAPDAGTYWYHSHNRSWEQVARGLAGPLIVEEAEPWAGLEGAATREVTCVLDDWRLVADGAIHEESFGALHDAAHGGRLGNTVTLNGASETALPVRAGERLRLRLINAATARVMPLRIDGHAATVIARDGFATAPQAMDEVVLAPAQRADIVIDCTGAPGSRASILLDAGRGEWVPIASLAYSGEAPLPTVEAPVRPLPDPAWRDPDLGSAQREELLMEGGAMGGLSGAMLDGTRLDARALAEKGKVWAFNGIAGGMHTRLFRIARDRTMHLTLRNDTAWPHGIHLHGHHFQVLSRDGVAEPGRVLHDTVLAGPREVVEIAFVADNPGKWMIHCHMLDHQASGMMGWFEVA